MQKTLTVEQHKQAVALGIKLRVDDKWGFKKKCANSRCQEVIDDRCYCADEFERAVYEVQNSRSAYSCSSRCWALSGQMKDCVSYAMEDEQDVLDWISKSVGDRVEKEQVDRVVDFMTKTGDNEHLSNVSKKIYVALNDYIREVGDWDYDGDDFECGCDMS